MAKSRQQKLGQQVQAYLLLIRFDKPVGTFLLLWPALWGLLLARPGWPEPRNSIIFVLGTFLMRSAGCAINDFADRDIDGLVARTAHRPLAQGLIAPWQAVCLALFLAVCSFCLVLLTNQLTIILSFGAVILAGVYPLTKRWIQSPQLVLGIAFAWAIPMGFAAELGKIPLIAWAFFAMTIGWVVAYDTYYALADRDDDQKLQIGSTALLFKQAAPLVSVSLHIVFLVLFLTCYCLAVSQSLADSLIVLIGVVMALCCAVGQYRLARSFKPYECIKAFKLNNITGFILTLSLLLTKL